MRQRIVDCEILDPASGKRFWGYVEWEDGVICEVGQAGPGEAGEVSAGVELISAHGNLLAPSFVDLYADFCEPGFEYRENIASGSAAAAAGGYTHVLLRPDTDPCVDGEDTVRFVLEAGAKAGLVNVLPAGCLSRKLDGESLAEIGEMADAGVVALSEGDRYLKKGGFLRRCMEYGDNFHLPVILTNEDPTLVEGVVHEGLVSAISGLKTSPSVAKEVAVARHIALAELTRAKTHLAKISSAASVRLIKDAKARGVPVTASVAIHNLILNDTSTLGYDPMFKIWPPARSEEDRKLLLEAVIDGTIDTIVSDHSPKATEDKELEFDLAATGALSIELVFPLLNKLVLAEELDLVSAIRAVTVGPRRFLGIAGGEIAKGQPADLVVLDRNTDWELDYSELRSRGRNTPFLGQRFVGRTYLTINRGRVTFRRDG